MDEQYPPWRDLLQWLNTAKDRIETIQVISPEQIVPGGTLDPSLIPDLSFTKIQLTTAPRLLGRTTAGAGDAEEIRVAGGLALSGGILSVAGLPSGYAIGDLLYADSATTLARLPDVAVGSYLRSGGVLTAPLWSTLKLPNAGAVGDVPFVSATNVVTMLTSVSAGSYLRSGGLLTAPVWSTLKLPNAATSGDILKASSADTYASAAPQALTKTDDTNVTLTLGGTPLTALVNAASLTLGWTGVLSVARGGTGTGTTLTTGSVVFAGVSGVLSQDNSNFFWDNSLKRLGIGTVAAPLEALDVRGNLRVSANSAFGGTNVNSANTITVSNTVTDPAGVSTGASISKGVALTAINAQSVYGVEAAASVANAFNQTGTIGGLFAQGVSSNTATVTRLYGVQSLISLTGAGTVTSAVGIQLELQNTHASGTMASAYGARVVLNSNSGTLTNTYGVYVGDITAGTQTNIPYSFYAEDAGAFNYFAGRVGIGQTAPTASLHLQAGTATASTAPLKFTSGTNLTTAEAGAVEYNGTNLFFTRAGTVRENVLVAIDNVAAPTTSIGAAIVNYYGAAATNFLGDPNRWLSVNVLGATYRIPLYN